MLNLTAIEQSIIDRVTPFMASINTQTLAFPEDFELSERAARKNHCLISYRNTNKTLTSDPRLNANCVTQDGTVTYEITLISRRLRPAPVRDDAGTTGFEGSIYEMLQLIEEALNGYVPVADLGIGPLYCTSQAFAARRNDCYIYNQIWSMDFLQQRRRFGP